MFPPNQSRVTFAKQLWRYAKPLRNQKSQNAVTSIPVLLLPCTYVNIRIVFDSTSVNYRLAMETLSHDDILALNLAVGEIYAVRDMESFYSAVFSSIKRLIPYELCSFNDVGLAPTRFLKIISRSQDHINAINKHLPALNTYTHEHPLFSHVTSDNVFKTTDVASKNQFKATAIYNEFYRHLDTDTQIGFSMPVSQQTVSLLALSRSNIDFSERDRLILTLLKPHCINALRNVTELGRVTLERDLLQRGVESEKKGVMLLRSDGMIVCISAFAQEMCGRYFAVTLTEGDTLPGMLLQWLETKADLSQPIIDGGNTQRTGAPGRAPKRVERDVFTIEKEGKRLTIRLMNDVTTGDSILFMTETDPSILLHRLHDYGLSGREAEVLFWISHGKTNAEIAVILTMSKRTAEKHLEHIFTKLGVETRAAAIAVMRNEASSS